MNGDAFPIDVHQCPTGTKQQIMSNRKPGQNWDDFRYFLAVARTGTLSAAAEQLRTEHTTVARHICSLEQELSSRLFHKSHHGYGLTQAGERLLAAAKTIESAFVSAKAAGQTRVVAGTVRVGAPDGFGSVFLAPRMHVLTHRHPELEIEILTIARRFSLSNREADIVIGLSAPTQMRVVSRRLTDFRFFVYASRTYLEQAKPIVGPKDFSGHPFIGFVEDLLVAPELNYLGSISADLKTRIRSTNLLTQLHATLGGGGLCILPALVASSYPMLVAVLPELISITLSLHMHVHEDNRKAAHVREVATFIATEVQRNRALFISPKGASI
jgi:DNA-binding transcriptional LysR family regulator